MKFNIRLYLLFSLLIAGFVMQSVSGVQLAIKTYKLGTILLYMQSSDTIAQVKEEIFAQKGVPVDLQRLVYKGKALANADTLSMHANLSDGETLLVVDSAPAPAESKTFEVNIKTYKLGTILLYMQPSDTIAQVKEKIFAQKGVPVDLQRLVYKGKALANADTLSMHANLSDGETYLVVESAPATAAPAPAAPGPVEEKPGEEETIDQDNPVEVSDTLKKIIASKGCTLDEAQTLLSNATAKFVPGRPGPNRNLATGIGLSLDELRAEFLKK